MASLRPHNPTRHPAPTTTTATPNGKLFGRHRDEAHGDHACKTKRSSGEERGRRSKSGDAAAGRTTADRNMWHTRRLFGCVQAEQAKEPRKGALARNVLGIREAVAATGGGAAAAGTRDAARGDSGTGWAKRFQRSSTASSDETGERQRRPQQENSVYSRAAAIVNTAMRMPSAASSAAGVATAGAAVTAAASPAPVPSYLQWPSKSKDAAEPKNGEEGGDHRKTRSTKKELSLGVGSRAGQSGSSGEAATTTSDEGSLGAVKSSRGGGGGGAVSLSFKEAMFAGAVSRSIAQVNMSPRCTYRCTPSQYHPLFPAQKLFTAKNQSFVLSFYRFPLPPPRKLYQFVGHHGQYAIPSTCAPPRASTAVHFSISLSWHQPNPPSVDAPTTQFHFHFFQTCMQPANVVKTLLQGRGTASQLSNLSFKLLTRGAGAQFIMSLPHGAFNYATLEVCWKTRERGEGGVMLAPILLLRCWCWCSPLLVCCFRTESNVGEVCRADLRFACVSVGGRCTSAVNRDSGSCSVGFGCRVTYRRRLQVFKPEHCCWHPTTYESPFLPLNVG